MSLDDALGLMFTGLVIAYLVAALLVPEKFE